MVSWLLAKKGTQTMKNKRFTTEGKIRILQDAHWQLMR
jgi:hypothetical protein